MTESLAFTSWQKAVFRNAPVVLALAFATVFATARTTGSGPSRGDIAAWIFVHDWMSRGAALYAEVWDHKDWGFFALNTPFYILGGITGLYIAGLVWVLVLAVGVYLGIRQIISWRPAAVIAAFSAVVYVAATSFLSTYTENIAIALAVLGLGLIYRFPFASGVVFALSSSVKVSGAVIFLAVLSCDVGLSAYSRRRPWGTAQSRVLAGFVLMGIVIAMLAHSQGSLVGWIDVINYNGEYAALRREAMPSILEVKDFLTFASPGLDTGVYVLACLGSLGLLSIAAFLPRQAHHSGERSEMVPPRARILLLNAALVLGVTFALVAQFPPRYQHYQYFVGAATSLGAVLAAFAITRTPRSGFRGSSLLLVFAVVLPVIAGTSVLVRAEGPLALAKGVAGWLHLSEGGDRIPALDGTSGHASLAFVNVGGRLVDQDSIPEGATLSCRFFYQYDHLLPRYEQEMLNCLMNGAGLVVIRQDSYGDREFDEAVHQLLESRYVPCESPNPHFELWAKSGSVRCPYR